MQPKASRTLLTDTSALNHHFHSLSHCDIIHGFNPRFHHLHSDHYNIYRISTTYLYYTLHQLHPMTYKQL